MNVTVSAGPPMSELSHQSCPFQEGYLRIFSVTFLQITCTCFPARFLVTIIFQQLSFQLMTGQNTSCPTTLPAGRENVLWSGKGDTNGLVLQQQRIDHAIRRNHFCALTTRFFVVSKSAIHTSAARSPGPSSTRRKGTSGEIQEVQQRVLVWIAFGAGRVWAEW